MSQNNFFDKLEITNENDIKFELKIPDLNQNPETCISVACANGLRRILISDLPIAEFDDGYDNNSDMKVNVLKNTSGLHNEFVAHRISLIPIKMYHPNLLGNSKKILENIKIDSIYDDESGKRVFTFSTPESLPIFHISEPKKETNSVYKVTSADFKLAKKIVLDGNSTYSDLEDNTDATVYFGDFSGEIGKLAKDRVDPIHINELKPNITSKTSEQLELICTPTIGFGRQNARYCPVGTVGHSLVVDEVKSEQVFNQKIIFKNKERIEKNLNEFTEHKKTQLKKSFELLDKHRVFHIDSQGNPNRFNFRVESIGFLPSTQLVYDSLEIMRLKLLDIVHLIQFKDENNGDYKFYLNSRLEISETFDNLLGQEISLYDEDHTIGNLITEFYKIVTHNNDKYPIKYFSYKVPHPLKAKLVFKTKLNKNINLKELFKKINITIFGITSAEAISNIKTPTNKIYLEQYITLAIFVLSIKRIVSNIDKMISEWSNLTKISESSFNQLDDPSFSTLYDSLKDFDLTSTEFHSTTINDVTSEIGNGDVVDLSSEK